MLVRFTTNIIVVLAFLVVNSLGQQFDWAKCIDGTGVVVNDIVKDAGGNNYIIGKFENTLTIGNTTLVSSGSSDIFFAKTDPFGNFLWAKKAGGPSEDFGRAITLDNIGNIYISGYFTGDAYFDGISISAYALKDLFIAKYSSANNCIWANKVGSAGDDWTERIKFLSHGEILLTGIHGANIWFGSHYLQMGYQDGANGFRAIMDSSGQFSWAMTFGSSYIDKAAGVDGDLEGTYFFSGNFGQIVAGPSADNQSPTLRYRAQVGKANSSGYLSDFYTTGSGDAFNAGVVCDSKGYVYIAGEYTETVIFDTIQISGNGAYFAKYNQQGKIQWVKTIPGTRAKAITKDTRDNFYIAGDFNGTVSIGDSIFTSNGIWDFFIAMFDSTGSIKWVNKGGGVSYDFIYAIAAGSRITQVGHLQDGAQIGELPPLSCNSAFIADIKNNYLKLLSPNRGDYLKAGSTVPITWDTHTLDTIRIEYSSDNGSSWNLITPYAHSKIYLWTVPQISSNQCRIRLVYDDFIIPTQDESDTNFVIYTEGNYSLYFDGADDFVGNMIEDKITGTTEFTVEVWVKLEDDSFRAIINKSPNWSYNLYHNLGFYWGINDFEPPTYAYYSVPSFSSWHHIACTKSIDGSINIFLDGIKVASKNYITGVLPSSSYDLQFGRYLGGGYFLKGWLTKIRISKIARYTNNFVPSLTYNLDTNTVGQWDFSTGVGSTLFDSGLNNIDGTIYGATWSTEFPANPLGSVTLISPNGGEIWQVGSSHNITWNHSNVANVKIEYTTDNGTSWSQIVASTSASTGSYSWTIPNTVSSSCKVKITDVDKPLVTDESNGTFGITQISAGNYSLYFDGISDYIGDIFEDKITGNSPFTLELWVKNESSGVAPLITRGANSGAEWSYNFYIYDSLYFGVNSPTKYTATSSPTQGEWHHLAAVRGSDGYLRIFVNGRKKSESYYGSTPLTSFFNLQFGKYFADGSSDYFKGYLTRVRLSKVARYITDFTPTKSYIVDAMTVGQWNFSEGTGSVLTDSSGNELSGTIYGAVWSTDFPETQINLTLTSPNGGENWHVGSSHNITWTQSNVSNVKLTYSTNNGLSWIQIVASTPASTGSYSWTIPNSVSASCKVKITDVSNSSVSDQSDNTFTISVAPVPSITVSSPNGGENWQVGSSHSITWTQTNVSNVKIDYSANNGTSWVQVVASTPASLGSYSWTVPNTVSTNCRVRITDVINSSVNDQSNNIFTISAAPSQSITVTSPNGGENWQVGSSHNITWTQSNISNIKIEYTTDDGSTFSQIIASTPASEGSYTWVVPNTISTNCRVKLTDVANSMVTDLSNNFFAISPATVPSVTLTSPNGGEKWFVGAQYSITWNSANADTLKLEYSTNGGTDWILIEASAAANLGSYIWTIPNTPSADCILRISSTSNSGIFDVSDAWFAIAEVPAVTLTSPNGSEKWMVGKQYSITWSAVALSKVKADYSTNNGSQWILIADSVSTNLGSYIWTVPNTESNNCLVRLTGVDEPTVSDQSNSPFTIELERNLTLTSPAAGETYTSGQTMSIRWTFLNLENVDIYYSVDNGANWQPVADSVNASSQLFEWLIPETNSNEVKMRVVYTLRPDLRSEVDGTITILPSPKVVLQSNLSGAFMKVGSRYTIQWFVENVSAINILYTSDGGTLWNEIAANIPATVRAYEWVIPDLNSKNCRIKIEASNNPSLFSTNDIAFTVYSYSQSVTVSNVWQFGDIKDIGNYRLISIPGNVSGDLGGLMSGKFINDWNAYWDNGNDVDYQIQYNGGSQFNLQPGKGFWVLSKDPINLSKQSEAVTIDSTLLYYVPLHKGWNIIGNVFAKSLNWSDLRVANNLPQSSLLYYWDGKWNFPSVMDPYKGYYFFNPDNRSSLKIIYPVETSLAKVGLENPVTGKEDGIVVSFGENEILATFDPASSTGLDTNDYLLPGANFSRKRIAFTREDNGITRQLFIDSQPWDSLGNRFRFSILNETSTPDDLKLSLKIEQKNLNIYLLDEKYSEFIDLRVKNSFKLSPQKGSRYYSLMIGDDSFIRAMRSQYLPTEYLLYQNFPNPFNPETSIKYALPADGYIKLKLYDILGNEVLTLFEGEESAGVHTRTFNLSGFASGVYLYRLETGGTNLLKKMILMK